MNGNMVARVNKLKPERQMKVTIKMKEHVDDSGSGHHLFGPSYGYRAPYAGHAALAYGGAPQGIHVSSAGHPSRRNGIQIKR